MNSFRSGLSQSLTPDRPAFKSMFMGFTKDKSQTGYHPYTLGTVCLYARPSVHPLVPETETIIFDVITPQNRRGRHLVIFRDTSNKHPFAINIKFEYFTLWFWRCLKMWTENEYTQNTSVQ